MLALRVGQLPAPPDKDMYRRDPLQTAILNLSTNRTDPRDVIMAEVTDDTDALKTRIKTEPNDTQNLILQPNVIPAPPAAGKSDKLDFNGFVLEFNAILASHGWVTTGPNKETLPYIVRGNCQRLLPLCVVEKTFLAPYPGPYPEKELRRAPMKGYYLTTEEVRLLNRFVDHAYTQSLGLGRFSLKDMLVGAVDFVDFFHRVKSITPMKPVSMTLKTTNEQPTVQGGWSQMNNTIVPYVLRNRVKMVPLSVVRYASGLLNDVEVPSLVANADECKYLNEVCSEVGMDFQFSSDTRLIELFLVPTLSNKRVSITELPKKDPIQHAKFVNRINDRRSVFVAASVRSQELQLMKPLTTPKISPLKSSSTPKSMSQQAISPDGPVGTKLPISRIYRSPPPLTPAGQITPTSNFIAQPMPAMHRTILPAQSLASQPTVAMSSVSPTVQAPAVKICPKHGVRVSTPQTLPNLRPIQPAIQTQGQFFLSPSIQQPIVQQFVPQNGGIFPGQRPPMLIIRLNRPLAPGEPLPLLLPSNMMVPIIVHSPVMHPPPQMIHIPTPITTPTPPVVIKIESDDDDEQSEEAFTAVVHDSQASLPSINVPCPHVKEETPIIKEENSDDHLTANLLVNDQDILTNNNNNDLEKVITSQIKDIPNEALVTIMENRGSIPESIEHITEFVEPITESTEPITESTEPIMEFSEPITESTELITEFAEHITESTEPITRITSKHFLDDSETDCDSPSKRSRTDSGFICNDSDSMDKSIDGSITSDIPLLTSESSKSGLESLRRYRFGRPHSTESAPSSGKSSPERQEVE